MSYSYIGLFFWLAAITQATASVLPYFILCDSNEPVLNIDDNTAIDTVIAIVNGTGWESTGSCINVRNNTVTLARNLTENCDKLPLSCSFNCSDLHGIHYEIQLHIQIVRVSNYTLEFTSPNYTATIPEGSEPGTLVDVTVGVRIAECNDGSKLANIEYLLLQNGGGKFRWQRETGNNVLTVNGRLDYELRPTYDLQLQAKYDMGSNNSVTGNTNITVNVTDVDDNNPVFDMAGAEVYRMSIQEQNYTVINMTLTTKPPIHAYDPDLGINAMITYSIVDQKTSGLFVIDPKTGTLQVTQKLDREHEDFYRITLQAAQTNRATATALATLEVTVTDVDDNEPIFSQDTYHVNLTENANEGTFVARVSATDADSGDNANFTYVLLSDQSVFSIQPDGTILVETPQELDRETNETLTILVGTKEIHGKTGQNNATVTVRLLDINDNNPIWNKTAYSFNIVNATSGTIVGKMTAVDDDEGANGKVTYMVVENTQTSSGCGAAFPRNTFPFTISLDSGDVHVEASSAVACSTYSAMVRACDNSTVQAQRRCSMTMLHLSYNNTHGVQKISRNMSIYENAPNGSIVGDLSCSGDTYDFQTTLTSPAFRVGKETHFLITQQLLDREEQDTYSLKINVSTAGQITCIVSVSVTIMDFNDNSPELNDTYTFTLPDGVQGGAVIGQLEATDTDIGDNGKISYYILSKADRQLFSINESTGKFKVAADADLSRHMYTVVVVARDNGRPRMETHVTVYIMSTHGSDVAVSVPTPWTKTKVLNSKQQLERDISAILNRTVAIETVEDLAANSNDTARSRVHISASLHGIPLTREELLRRTVLYYESIRALFYTGHDGDDESSSSALGPPEIALIAKAVVILIGAVLAICIIYRQFNSHKRYRRLYENLTRNGSMYESQELKVNIDDETSDYNGSVITQDLEETDQKIVPELTTAFVNPAYGDTCVTTDEVTVITTEAGYATQRLSDTTTSDTSMEDAIESLDQLSDRLEQEDNGAATVDVTATAAGRGAIENDTGESFHAIRDKQGISDNQQLEHVYENTQFPNNDIPNYDIETTGKNNNTRSESPVKAQEAEADETISDQVDNDEPKPDYDIKQVRFSHEVLDTDENKLEPLKATETEDATNRHSDEKGNLSSSLSDMIESKQQETGDRIPSVASFGSMASERDGEPRLKEVLDVTGWAEDEINSPNNVVNIGEADTHDFFFGEEATTAL